MVEGEEPDVEPVSYTVPIGRHEYILRKTSAQARADIERILKDKPWESTSDTTWHLIARPLIPRLQIPVFDPSAGKGSMVRTITPLDAHIRLSCEVPLMAEAIALDYLMVKRVRTYLAFASGVEVGVHCECTYANWSSSQEYEGEDLQARASDLHDAWTSAVVRTRMAQFLLDAIPIETRLGRAIGRSGSSILSTDPEDSYLHAWTAIELLAFDQFIREGGKVASTPTDTVIRSYLKRSGRSPGRATIRAYEGLRNDVAHGQLTQFRFHDLISVLGDVKALARELLVDELQARGLAPKTDKPFTSRTVIGSWRGKGKPTITPYSEVYAPKRVTDFPSRKKDSAGKQPKRSHLSKSTTSS